MDSVDALVIGAGVVGLAIARELALAGHEVIVIDQAEGIGTGTSSRNSEVIHAGLYYAPGSLKAQLCSRAANGSTRSAPGAASRTGAAASSSSRWRTAR